MYWKKGYYRLIFNVDKKEYEYEYVDKWCRVFTKEYLQNFKLIIDSLKNKD